MAAFSRLAFSALAFDVGDLPAGDQEEPGCRAELAAGSYRGAVRLVPARSTLQAGAYLGRAGIVCK
jgi:hypothetical protein